MTSGQLQEGKLVILRKAGRFCVNMVVLLACVIAGWTTTVTVPASSSDEPEKIKSSPRVELGETIRRELQAQCHEPWEAIYYGGQPAINQRVAQLFLSNKRGYVCLCTYSEDMGAIRKVSDRLTLTSSYGDHGPLHCTDTKDFVLVPWETRLYLIEENRVVEFCNAVNAGEEPRNEDFQPYLLREDDWKKKVKGLPSLPKPWGAKYLLKSPIDCDILTVSMSRAADVPIPEFPYGNGTSSGIRCTINVGQGKGLFPGMMLFSQDPDVPCTAYVLSSSDGTSDILVARYIKSFDETKKALEAGLRLSTRRLANKKTNEQGKGGPGGKD
jgi:hypothetical protein